MGKEPDPHACRPNSMDLNDAADMRDEAEQAFNDARNTRGKRDLLYVAVMACVIVMLTILTTIFTPDIVSGTRGNNEGNRRGKH